MDLFTSIGCSARDLSGERKRQTGENIDIKLWYSEEEVIETEPFAGIEVKKVGGIDKRALEAYHADTWKARRPIKVIIGNPPYLAASTNPYDISAYKTETDGITDFGERKHWLNDDYVKFFRGVSLAELFPTNVTGIVSGNDGAAIAPTKAELIRRMDIVKNATEEKDIFDLWGR